MSSLNVLCCRRWLSPVGPTNPPCLTSVIPAQVRSQRHRMYVMMSSRRLVTSSSLVSADQPKFRGSIDEGTGVVRLVLPGTGSSGGGVEEVLVCQELWDMVAANVACRAEGHHL